MMVPLRKSRGGQFLTPLGSPEDMDLEEVRAWGQTCRAQICPSFHVFCCSQLSSEPPMTLFPQLIQDISRLQRRSLRHSRQLEVPRPYIAARFSVLPPTFHPGDQKQYGGFDNRGLEPGHRYVLFVLAVLQKSEPVSPEWCLPDTPLNEADPISQGLDLKTRGRSSVVSHRQLSVVRAGQWGRLGSGGILKRRFLKRKRASKVWGVAG